MSNEKMNLTGTRLDIAEKLKDYVDSKRNKDGTALSAAFVKDDEVVAAFVCGTRDGTPEKPATINDLFGIGSVSKVYCTMSVMKLVEMGKVKLDTPIVEYIPRFTMADERYKQITLRMLLNHSSGIPGTNIKYAGGTRWFEGGVYDEFYDYFSKSKLKDNPGNTSVYCNDGLMLAEMVVSEISGMTYTRFLQEYIAKPIDALSVCSGESNPENLVREKGKVNEYIMSLGAGGLFTSIIDCAKVGYVFVDTKGILNSKSLDEISRPQGKTFLSGIAENYGLGWDTVNFVLDPYDFGENVLAKGGGTFSFNSYLLVIKKYNLAAAISLTHDNRLDSTRILCELCNLLLNDYGIDTQKKAEEKKTENVKKPIPIEYAETYSGMYYNYSHNLRISFNDDLLSIQFRTADGWGDMVKDASFDGQRFFAGPKIIEFEKHENSCYMIESYQSHPFLGRMAMAQKCSSFPPLSKTWKNRIGKKYITCDAFPTTIFMTPGLTIQEFENAEGILFFTATSPRGLKVVPVVPAGQWETEMFLNAPGQGSRDGFAPFIYEKDGIEYLYAFGLNLIDISFLKPIQTGRVISDKSEQNRIYSMTAGSKIKVEKIDGVRVVTLNADLSQKYDSVSGQELTETSDGFILFINENPMNVSVEVCPK